jgi:hypothetical protein
VGIRREETQNCWPLPVGAVTKTMLELGGLLRPRGIDGCVGLFSGGRLAYETKPAHDQLSDLGCGPRANVRNDRGEGYASNFTFSDPNRQNPKLVPFLLGRSNLHQTSADGFVFGKSPRFAPIAS